MGIFIAIIGGLIWLFCSANAITVSPTNAAQQAVAELRAIEAILGVAIFALGVIVHRLRKPKKTA